MYYILYKTTNIVNGKIYVGCHKTLKLNDDYLGSGTILKRAIVKYGINNFKREILEYCNNAEDMFKMESILVDSEFVQKTSNYNVATGGHGGWGMVNDGSAEHIKRCVQAGKLIPSLETKQKMSIAQKQQWIDQTEKEKEQALKHLSNIRRTFTGQNHTEDTKRKIGKANSKKQKGKGNSQYGTRWIYSLEEKRSRKIKKDDLLPDGWLEGRKLKF